MNARLQLDVDNVDRTAVALSPSLQDSDAVQYTVTTDDTLTVMVDARSLGALRGAVNTVLMLANLSTTVQDTFEDDTQ